MINCVTAFYYSLKTRVQLLNNFISLIKAKSGKKVMIAYVDPRTTQDNIMWVDDIEIQDMLTINNLGNNSKTLQNKGFLITIG